MKTSLEFWSPKVSQLKLKKNTVFRKYQYGVKGAVDDREVQMDESVLGMVNYLSEEAKM